MSDDSLARANESIRKGARFSITVLPVPSAAILIASAVYYHRGLALAIPIGALVAFLYVLYIRRLSRIQFTEEGIAHPDKGLILWTSIVTVYPRWHGGAHQFVRSLRLKTGKLVRINFFGAWSLSDIDTALTEHVAQRRRIPEHESRG